LLAYQIKQFYNYLIAVNTNIAIAIDLNIVATAYSLKIIANNSGWGNVNVSGGDATPSLIGGEGGGLLVEARQRSAALCGW
jgi:hypothetical protein